MALAVLLICQSGQTFALCGNAEGHSARLSPTPCDATNNKPRRCGDCDSAESVTACGARNRPRRGPRTRRAPAVGSGTADFLFITGRTIPFRSTAKPRASLPEAGRIARNGGSLRTVPVRYTRPMTCTAGCGRSRALRQLTSPTDGLNFFLSAATRFSKPLRSSSWFAQNSTGTSARSNGSCVPSSAVNITSFAHPIA